MQETWGFSHWNVGTVSGINSFWREFVGVFPKSYPGLHCDTLLRHRSLHLSQEVSYWVVG